MQFTHVHLPENTFKAKRVEKDGFRYYAVDEDETKYTSITSVLSCRNSLFLDEWKQRVGEEEAAKVSRIASQTGTQIHKAAENYLNNVNPFTTDDDVKFFAPTIVPRFKKFKKLLDRINFVHAQEAMMVSKKLGLGGTVDCIAEFDGVLSIIDFKTSKRLKDRLDIKNYFAQETAYAIMFYETTGIKINNLVTLISVDGEEDQVFIEKPSDHFEYLKESIEMYKNGMRD